MSIIHENFSQNILNFLAPVLKQDFLNLVVQEMRKINEENKDDLGAVELLQILKQAAFDAVYTLSILDLPSKDMRILEVGAGTGILGAFLHSEGWNISMLEPARIGFENHVHLTKRVATELGFPLERLFLCQIEDMGSAYDDSFDLIFSNNVLEHVENVEKCLRKMNYMLASKGLMIHNCPNYSVPYEPHFGIPLIPIKPKTTEIILPRHIRKSGLWNSLNFVTAAQISRLSKECGSIVYFKHALLYEALLRLDKDTEYANRHRIIYSISSILRKLGVLKLFKLLPPSLSTPMIFSWRKQ